MDRTPLQLWTSFHAFLADPAKSELWLTQAAVPMIKAWRAQGTIRSWFFVRYWEGGPHLRLRLLALDQAQHGAVKSALTQSIPAFCSAAPPTRAAYYAGHGFDGVPVDQDALPWFDEGSLVEIPYEPEIQRYGGTAAMAHSEDLFAVSSQLCAGIVAATAGAMDVRLQRAALILAVAIQACGLTGAAARDYAAGHARMWAAYSPQTRDQARLLQGQATSPADQAGLADRIFDQAAVVARPGGALAPFAAAVAQWRARLDAIGADGALVIPFTGQAARTAAEVDLAIRQVLGSQLHMTCNRLGLSPHLELAVASQLAGAMPAETDVLETV